MTTSFSQACSYQTYIVLWKTCSPEQRNMKNQQESLMMGKNSEKKVMLWNQNNKEMEKRNKWPSGYRISSNSVWSEQKRLWLFFQELWGIVLAGQDNFTDLIYIYIRLTLSFWNKQLFNNVWNNSSIPKRPLSIVIPWITLTYIYWHFVVFFHK